MGDPAATVILIHGLWMRGLVMLPFERWLRAEGFAVRRFSYPSWRGSLASNVRALAGFVQETPGASIHFVAHSLGGLVTLAMLAQQHDRRIGRVVLMGTPYGGCHCGHTLAGIPVLKPLVGRTFKDWFAQPPAALPPALELGVIAGTRPVSFGRLIPGLARPNDGLIAVDETRIACARDHISLPLSHSGMLISSACANQVASFLRAGRFIHA